MLNLKNQQVVKCDRKKYSTRFFTNFFARKISTKVASTSPNGSVIYHLSHDRQIKDSEELYSQRSLNQFSKILKPHHYYILVNKGVLSQNGILDPGHIASFLTNDSSSIIQDSCMSLRPADVIPNKTLVYKIEHDNINRARTARVSRVKFLTIEEELKNHFFKNAEYNITGKVRFLIEIPINLLHISEIEIIEATKMTIQRHKNGEFVLCAGKIDNEPVKQLNCVIGFQGSLKLRGADPNPSPQMAAWSYLRFIFGEFCRDELVCNSGLRIEKVERTYDDMLQYTGDSSITSRFG